MNNYNYLICGAGLAGCAAARRLADNGQNVLIIEKLPHIGGSIYDFMNSNGVLVHKYGPHIFHTNNKDAFVFLSRFTEWNGYTHRVAANIGDNLSVPVPFNLQSLRTIYGEQEAPILHKLVKDEFFTDTVSILTLLSSQNPKVKELGNTIYNKIFFHYTLKQWGKQPSEVSPETTSRVPVRFTEDDRYFTDIYQGLPVDGYTNMLQKMVSHKNIDIILNTNFLDNVALRNGEIYYNNELFNGKVIYCGQIEHLFDKKYGVLPYRTLDFVFEDHKVDSYQSHATVNYTVSENFTRISEFKKMTLQKIDGVTTILKEFPRQFEGKTDEIPYYPIDCEQSANLYNQYKSLANDYKNLFLLGRLAEYKYYNMDAVVVRALNLCDSIC